jgi:hypothetical protein
LFATFIGLSRLSRSGTIWCINVFTSLLGLVIVSHLSPRGLGTLHTSNISQGGIAWKASDKKLTSLEASGGRLNQLVEQRSLPWASRTVRRLCADGPMLCRWFGQPSRTFCPWTEAPISTQSKKGMQGQNTCNAHGRLVKVSPTFDQLLSKYASKKIVLGNRPAKKPQTKWPNKTARKATQQASPIHPMMPGCSPLAYSSSIYCPI